MKRFVLSFLVALLIVNSVLAASVARDFPRSASQGETISVTLEIRDFYRGGDIVVGELLPKGARLLNWSVLGAQETKDQISFSSNGQSLVWRFTANTPTPIVLYTVVLPSEGDVAIFDAVYALSPDEIGHVVDKVVLVPGTLEDSSVSFDGPTGAFLGITVDPTAITGGFVLVLLFLIIMGTLHRSHPSQTGRHSTLPGDYVFQHITSQDTRSRVGPPHEQPRHGPPVQDCAPVRPRPSVYPFTYTPIAPLRDDSSSQKNRS